MTDKPTPKEIDDLVYELRQAGKDDTYSLASAVLAKCGQPAQAEEPVAWKHDCAALLTNDVELWIDACPHCGKPRNAPKPVGRVPLTDEQIQDLLLCGDPTDEEMRLIRIGWDAARGIKGGQHGAE